MNNSLREELIGKIRKRKIAIFGTGKLAYIGEEYLKQLGINEFIYFDNDIKKQQNLFHNKMVLSPNIITKDWFILISTDYYQPIMKQLIEIGLQDMSDFINLLDLSYYEAIISCKDAPKVPAVTQTILNNIDNMLKKKINLKTIDWFNMEEFELFEQKLGFGEAYHKEFNKRYKRKIIEYYLVFQFLKFEKWNKNDIYLDIGGGVSPFAKYLREKLSICAFGIDLEKGIYGYLDYYLQEDATKTHFDTNSVKAISMQSAYEMFAGSDDVDFVKEAARILSPGGQVIILPLYMHEQYLSTTSPGCYGKGYADKDSLECVRFDCGAKGVALGRFYDADALERRVLINAISLGLRPEIYVLPDIYVEKDDFVYLKYILVLKKDK